MYLHRARGRGAAYGVSIKWFYGGDGVLYTVHTHTHRWKNNSSKLISTSIYKGHFNQMARLQTKRTIRVNARQAAQ